MEINVNPNVTTSKSLLSCKLNALVSVHVPQMFFIMEMLIGFSRHVSQYFSALQRLAHGIKYVSFYGNLPAAVAEIDKNL